jgi:putative ABC transport system ATP-binding protein
VTIISATHDIKMLDVSDRVVRVRDGQIERIEERKDMEISVGTIDGRTE